MSVHATLRDLLEPIYQDNYSLKENLKSAQASLNRLRTAAWEQFPQLIKPTPQHIYFTLTANCNLACKGCHYGRDFMPGEELSYDLVRDALEDSRQLRFEVVRLYGGEPLLHRRIADIVADCARLELRTYLSTNGILLKKKIDDLYAAGLRRISIGVYGEGAEYDAYVQRRNQFERLRASLEYVRERYGNKLQLQLNWLLMKPTCSVESVRAAWSLAMDYRMPIYINLVHYSLPYFTQGQDHALQLREADRPQIEAVIAEFLRLQALRADLLPMSPTVLRSIPDWLIQGPNMRVPCDRHRLIWIGADGTVQMCYVTFKLGNLHQQRLRDLLFTQTHRQAARDAFKLNCPNCHCAYESRTLAHAATLNKYASANA